MSAGDNLPSLADEVREKEWTQDELMEKAFVGPEDEGTTSVVYYEEWDENPEEAPDNVEIREDEDPKKLIWGYEGFTIEVWNESFGEWGAKVYVPEEYTGFLYGDHRVKADFAPHVGDMREGYVEGVEHLDDGWGVIAAKTATNHQPMVAMEAMVRDIIEHTEVSEQGAEDAREALRLAKENEAG